jgi:Type ISP C-terminal specificity domain
MEANEQGMFYHTLAVLHAPAYREENAGALGQDWPRVPLPDSRDALLASAALGRQIAALLDTETPVPGVTKGSARAELRLIGPIQHIEGRQLRPEAGELDVTAGWGHGGKGDVTMPGRGKVVEREYTPLELAAFAEGATALSMTLDDALACLGETTRDVYLNGVAYWANIPAKVWEFTIGGYQVMKKWLSYRERALLGRALTVEEVREVTHMARRIAVILLLAPTLDRNYRDISGSAHSMAEP